ncbi:MAG: ASPIC/UnbV domain-containing [Planctomycetota bacterium]|nr:MAG: ASPIC/UnbV domain-containing [Planctomycetota bacterium]
MIAKPPVVPVKRLKVPVIIPICVGVLGVVIALMVYLKHLASMPRVEKFLVRPEKFVVDFAKSEGLHDQATGGGKDPKTGAAIKGIKGTFLKGMRERDWGMMASGMAKGFRARFPGVAEGKDVPDGLIRIRQYEAADLKGELDQDKFIAVMKEHIGPWAAVERAVWRSFEFLAEPDEDRAFLSAHFQLAGILPDGGRADFQAVIQARVNREGDAWKVKHLGLVEGWRAESSFAPFSDITDQVGLAFNESEERRKIAQELINERGVVTNGGLTVADFNHDGFPDVLAASIHNDAVLFTNDGQGGFTRGPVVNRPEECGYTWLCVDLDGDGVEELVSSQILSYEGNKAKGALYKRKGDTWALQPEALVFPIGPGERDLSIQGIVPHDIDGNGLLDLFFCVYSNRNSKGPKYNRVMAFDGADNHLFMNKGHLAFTEESEARGIRGTQYTYVAKFWDFDFDGDTDLFEGNDFGPNHLWLNDGKGRFSDATDHIFDADSNYTMGVTVADWDNTGAWSMYISNMYSHAGNRIIPLMKGVKSETKELGMLLARGNQMYEYVPAGRQWIESGVKRGVNWADWAWACLFWDPDNDGDRDLFVADGYTTNSDPKTPDY